MISATQLSPPLFFSFTIYFPLSQKSIVLRTLKKVVSFGNSASIRIGQGSQCHLYAGFFTRLLETGFEGKQGKYVNALLIED